MAKGYRVIFSAAKFNMKHNATYSDIGSAKRAVEEVFKKGIWIENEEKISYWPPESIAKAEISKVIPDEQSSS